MFYALFKYFKILKILTFLTFKGHRDMQRGKRTFQGEQAIKMLKNCKIFQKF